MMKAGDENANGENKMTLPPWRKYEIKRPEVLKERLNATEAGRYLLKQHYVEDMDGGVEVLAKLLYSADTGCHIRFDGLYYCNHLYHQDGLGNVYFRFHPDGLAAMTKDYRRDPVQVFEEDLARENKNYNPKIHEFEYTCQLLSSEHGHENLFEVDFRPINETATRYHEHYGAHPNGYIRIDDGQFSHKYTDQNWTHTRPYKFAEFEFEDDGEDEM